MLRASNDDDRHQQRCTIFRKSEPEFNRRHLERVNVEDKIRRSISNMASPSKWVWLGSSRAEGGDVQRDSASLREAEQMDAPSRPPAYTVTQPAATGIGSRCSRCSHLRALSSG